jgi:hypothetical protein
VIKSRRIRWAGHVAIMGGMRNAYNFFFVIIKETDHSEDLVVDGKVNIRMDLTEIG